MQDVCLVIPCYNEEHRLPVTELLAFVDGRQDTTLCLVDDGSSDGTLNVLHGLQRDRPGRVIVHGVLPNADGLLLPGMFVRVRMPFGPPRPVLEVPDEALAWAAELAVEMRRRVKEQQAFIGVAGTAGNLISSSSVNDLMFRSGTNIDFSANSGATLQVQIHSDGGITVGAPTGGSKGAGTINVAAGIYLNGTLYTNP